MDARTYCKTFHCVANVECSGIYVQERETSDCSNVVQVAREVVSFLMI